MMHIYRFLPRTGAEGPGIRACIWVSGCKHGCKGCFAKHTWDIEAGEKMSVEEVVSRLDKVMDEIDGITFLGGEPFDQAQDLAKVASYIKAKGKNVISFSGYTYEELLADDEKNVLLKETDLLCDGPYIEQLTDYSRPLLGSKNQRFIYLTDQISKEDMENYHNCLEIRVKKNGQTEINGMGDIEKLRESLGKELGKENGLLHI